MRGTMPRLVKTTPPSHLFDPDRRRAPLAASRPALHDRVVILRPCDGIGIPRASLIDDALQQALHCQCPLPPAYGAIVAPPPAVSAVATAIAADPRMIPLVRDPRRH